MTPNDTEERLTSMADYLRKQRATLADRHDRATQAAKAAPRNQAAQKAHKDVRKACHARMRAELRS
jgi:hypothetical protein